MTPRYLGGVVLFLQFSDNITPLPVVEYHLGRSAEVMEELKMRLRALLHQRDMLSYERDSLELFDLRMEIDAEIRELHRKLRKTA